MDAKPWDRLRWSEQGRRRRPLARSMLPLPFPRGVVRDLLAITRGLHRAEQAGEAPDLARLARLGEVGQLYRLALEMGTKYEPDTMAGRAAVVKADRATTALGEFVAASDELLGSPSLPWRSR